MPLITTNRAREGTLVQIEGGKLAITHAEEMDDIMAATKADRLDRDGTNGFTKKKLLRRIGRLGNVDLLRAMQKYPEILRGDRQAKDKAWYKILNSDPEFSHCRTVRAIRTR